MKHKYSHLVEVDVDKEELTILRFFEDGQRILYTRIPFSRIETKGYSEFISELGEAIAFDVPALRRLFERIKND